MNLDDLLSDDQEYPVMLTKKEMVMIQTAVHLWRHSSDSKQARANKRLILEKMADASGLKVDDVAPAKHRHD